MLVKLTLPLSLLGLLLMLFGSANGATFRFIRNEDDLQVALSIHDLIDTLIIDMKDFAKPVSDVLVKEFVNDRTKHRIRQKREEEINATAETSAAPSVAANEPATPITPASLKSPKSARKRAAKLPQFIETEEMRLKKSNRILSVIYDITEDSEWEALKDYVEADKFNAWLITLDDNRKKQNAAGKGDEMLQGIGDVFQNAKNEMLRFLQKHVFEKTLGIYVSGL